MPQFAHRQPASPEPVAPPRPEPAGLDAFVARADVTAPPAPESPPTGRGRGQGRSLPSSPMPVRFPPDVKAALERLSQSDDRSQQQILERVAFPAILAAAAALDSAPRPGVARRPPS